jgi:hypothetical protein
MAMAVALAAGFGSFDCEHFSLGYFDAFVLASASDGDNRVQVNYESVRKRGKRSGNAQDGDESTWDTPQSTKHYEKQCDPIHSNRL